jgi:predicted O-linked N-acetylglucosamine transferase (SPINDLY family)
MAGYLDREPAICRGCAFNPSGYAESADPTGSAAAAASASANLAAADGAAMAKPPEVGKDRAGPGSRARACLIATPVADEAPGASAVAISGTDSHPPRPPRGAPDSAGRASTVTAGAPDHAAALAQAIRDQQTGELERAEAGFRDMLGAVQADEALHRLGIARLQRGDPETALVLLRAAETLAPDPRLTHNLAAVLSRLGRADAAQALQRRNVADHPHYVPSYRALSALLEAAGDRNGAAGVELVLADRALAAGQDALISPAVARVAILDPGHRALPQVANRLRIAGRQAHALTLLEARIAHDPDDLGARLSQAMARLAVVHGSAAEIAARRDAYQADLTELDRRTRLATPEALTAASAQVGTAKPFFLAYQGEDDRALQFVYGGVISRMMAHHAAPALRRSPAGRIRVGFATAYFHLHSVSKLFGGWIRELDRSRFEVIGYHLGEGEDAVSTDLAACCQEFRRGPCDDTEWARRIAADGLDVLIYPEIGMHPTAVRLACRRLAPVQCVAWGHPVTTGLPAIDYFLSSDLMEPEGSEASYTETLVRLPNLSIHCEPPAGLDDGTDRDAAASALRAGLGFGADDVVYVCCQSLYKYHPRDDAVLPAIAARVPTARFLFIGDPARDPNADRLRDRLAAVFRVAGLDPGRHLRFAPPVPAGDFPALLRAGDVYLDSIGWSGGNTTLEAIACGLPIVTLPTGLMRGRHSAAILLVIGAEAYIARSVGHSVDLAAGLAAAPARAAARAAIRSGRHRLYRDIRPVRALERFLREAAGATEAVPAAAAGPDIQVSEASSSPVLSDGALSPAPGRDAGTVTHDAALATG